MSDGDKPDFATQAAQGANAGLLSELTAFLMKSKKWWLVPIVVAILALGLLVVLGGTGAAPFIYTLF